MENTIPRILINGEGRAFRDFCLRGGAIQFFGTKPMTVHKPMRQCLRCSRYSYSWLGHSLGSVIHLLIGSRYAVQRNGNIFMAFNNKEASVAIPLFSPVLVPMAQGVGEDVTCSQDIASASPVEAHITKTPRSTTLADIPQKATPANIITTNEPPTTEESPSKTNCASARKTLFTKEEPNKSKKSKAT